MRDSRCENAPHGGVPGIAAWLSVDGSTVRSDAGAWPGFRSEEPEQATLWLAWVAQQP